MNTGREVTDAHGKSGQSNKVTVVPPQVSQDSEQCGDRRPASGKGDDEKVTVGDNVL